MSYGASTKSSLAHPLNAGNSASRASTWLSIKFTVRMALNVTLDAGEARAAGSVTPNLCLRSTSPRFEGGMCASGWTAIHLLLPLIGRGLAAAAFCRGGAASKGNLRLTCTSSTNLARRQAASPGMGVASLGPDVAWLSGCASFVGVVRLSVKTVAVLCERMQLQQQPQQL
jgi:hypothetical protein